MQEINELNVGRLPYHSGPYVKQYDASGELLNKITKDNPYLVRPKRRYHKVRKRPVKFGQYSQFITRWDAVHNKAVVLAHIIQER